MLVQKPTKPLDETTRPTVVVEYNGELETGVLLFLGTIKGNKLAGVQLDNRRKLWSHKWLCWDGLVTVCSY